MPRRHSSSQLRQAVRNYNREVDRVNAHNKRVIDNYNRDVRAHNAKVRASRQRLISEIAKLNSRPSRVTYKVTYRTSVQTLVRSFDGIQESMDLGTWAGGEELFDLAERETANSVAALNAIEDPASVEDEVEDEFQRTVITTELREIGADLDDRWRGALYALNPSNPDAARHFCTSSREILVKILDLSAPDHEVLTALVGVKMTPNNQVPRRDKIRYCLYRGGRQDARLETFVDDDINDVMTLFSEFNPATHGDAGRYDLVRLGAMKRRVEGAIQFLHRIVSA